MKHIYTFLFSLFLGGFIFAQTTVLSDLNKPQEILINGTELYIIEINNTRVIKIDVSVSNPIITEVVTGLDYPSGFLLDGNDLYIAELQKGKIVKADISGNLPAATTDVVTGLSSPSSMALNGNDLYISDSNLNNIVKADISGVLPTTTTIEVVENLGDPVSLVLRGNELYIAENVGNKISKVDITTVDFPITASLVVTAGGPSFILENGDYLYISENSDNKISRINLTDQTAVSSDVLTNMMYPWGLAIDNPSNTLYYSELPIDEIRKYNLNLLSLLKNDRVSALTLFPNPVKETVTILGLPHTKEYRIYNLMGAMVYEGKISPSTKTDIKSLPRGVYFLSLEKQTFKFIKD